MHRCFLLTFLFFLILWGFAGYNNNEMQKIDRQIKQLEEMRRGFQAMALRHENQAEYLQFNDRALLEQRRHMQLAEENRTKAAQVQEQIDALNAQKDKLRYLQPQVGLQPQCTWVT